ncbi:hypothetical protein N7495_004872 [Penicillium taxi]|uniref:uncharacterized protein n=1 Tax=Penicillium taxi TaxID=168475 RepID=UPI0025456CEC|nr:uncharacterized protein N7495_004872 [Penicillium taxi]KAJ5900128.1 hypothetical protein N7495_004872 [Penicillium taxi]
MTELARRLGFESTEIDGLIKSSPDHQIARSALLQARKPDRYRYDREQFDILITRPPDLLADSIVKPRVRAGVPQTRTQKQDNGLLFLDYLHTDVEVTDTITSFFVRRCVYFAFFGKPAQNGLAPDGDLLMGDVPQLPLFVEEDEPSDSHVPTLAAASSSVPTRERQEELRGDGAQPREAQSMAPQQLSRSENEQETPDEDMSDQSSPRDESLSLRESNIKLAPINLATAPTYDSNSSTGPGDTDAISDYMRISIKADRPEQDLDEGPLIVVQQDALNDQKMANNSLQLTSPESEADHSSNSDGSPRQPALDAYLANYGEPRKSRNY